MTKTLNQIFFCSSTKIRIFFQQHWKSEYFFRKKNHSPLPPPPPWKLNDPSLTYFYFFNFDGVFFLCGVVVFLFCVLFLSFYCPTIFISPHAFDLYIMTPCLTHTGLAILSITTIRRLAIRPKVRKCWVFLLSKMSFISKYL